MQSVGSNERQRVDPQSEKHRSLSASASEAVPLSRSIEPAAAKSCAAETSNEMRATLHALPDHP